jgi:hypothetical protein
MTWNPIAIHVRGGLSLFHLHTPPKARLQTTLEIQSIRLPKTPPLAECELQHFGPPGL